MQERACFNLDSAITKQNRISGSGEVMILRGSMVRVVPFISAFNISRLYIIQLIWLHNRVAQLFLAASVTHSLTKFVRSMKIISEGTAAEKARNFIKKLRPTCSISAKRRAQFLS